MPSFSYPYPGEDTREEPEGTARVILYCGLLLIVLLAAVWPFLDTLGFYFTKGDTGATLYSSRILSSGDLVRVLTGRFNSLWHPRNLFYRPATSLSFSLDYALWGLNPLGYHLTELLLHGAAAGLLFRVVYLFNGRDLASGAAAGFLYTLHPLLVDVVPANNHRQETLVAVFLLAGLWGFWHREYDGGGRFSLGAALTCFVLSAGAKEVGFLFLPLVLVHLWIMNPDRADDVLTRGWAVLQRGRSYLIAAGLYAAWWVHVTEASAFFSTGGTWRPALMRGSWWKILRQQLVIFPLEHVPFYFRAVFHPFLGLYGTVFAWIPPLDWTRAAFPPTVRIASTVFGVLVMIGTVWWVRRTDAARPWRRLRRGALGVVLAVLAAFPLWAEAVDALVVQAYRGEGFSWLASMMDSPDRYAAADYVRKARGRILLGLGGVLLLLAGAELLERPRSILRRLQGALRRLDPRLTAGSSLVFYGVWLCLPALFYSFTRVAEFNNMYAGVLPLSALLGTLAVDSARSLGQSISAKRWDTAGPPAVLLGVVLVHVGSLAAASPLLKSYPAWEKRQQITRVYHGMLFDRLERLPSGSTLRLTGVARWTGKKEAFPHFTTAPVLNPRPWIQLHFPEADFELKEWSLRNVPDGEPGGFWLEQKRLGSHDFEFVTHRPSRGATIDSTTSEG